MNTNFVRVEGNSTTSNNSYTITASTTYPLDYYSSHCPFCGQKHCGSACDCQMIEKHYPCHVPKKEDKTCHCPIHNIYFGEDSHCPACHEEWKKLNSSPDRPIPPSIIEGKMFYWDPRRIWYVWDTGTK